MKIQKITVQRMVVLVVAVFALTAAFFPGTGAPAQAKPDALIGKKVRAQLVVNNGVYRCMNLVLKTNTTPCNFTVVKNGTGDYTVDFNFTVNNSYAQITAYYAASTPVVATLYNYPAADQIRIKTYNGASAIDSAFFITVY